MEKLIEALKADYPGLTFVVGQHFCWSPGRQEVYYELSGKPESMFGVLHEIGHARLGHKGYKTDVDLLKKEARAWQEASQLARHYGIALNENHVQDCLDTYRDWLHKRSICPTCGAAGIQGSPNHYNCLNCTDTWEVSTSRFCRPYRSQHKSQGLNLAFIIRLLGS